MLLRPPRAPPFLLSSCHARCKYRCILYVPAALASIPIGLDRAARRGREREREREKGGRGERRETSGAVEVGVGKGEPRKGRVGRRGWRTPASGRHSARRLRRLASPSFHHRHRALVSPLPAA